MKSPFSTILFYGFIDFFGGGTTLRELWDRTVSGEFTWTRSQAVELALWFFVTCSWDAKNDLLPYFNGIS